MLSAMFNTVAGKRIALFGFAFKADTGDTRESPARAVARALLAEQAHVIVTDPKALPNARADLADFEGTVEFEADPYEAAAGAHAIAILTGWESFRTLDYAASSSGWSNLPLSSMDGTCSTIESCSRLASTCSRSGRNR